MQQCKYSVTRDGDEIIVECRGCSSAATPDSSECLEALKEVTDREVGAGRIILKRDITRDVDPGLEAVWVRPSFSTTRVDPVVPGGARFLMAWEVGTLWATLYELPDRAENLYHVQPEEYHLPPEKTRLVNQARQRILTAGPADRVATSPRRARQHLERMAQQEIVDLAPELSGDEAGFLAGVLAKYTAGLGILEDILRDEHIQDIYVNAPVGHNPLHVVVDGAECTTNVYLSPRDVDAMISRFRSVSGRPFSEAAPVLDMELPDFHTRVAAVGEPLSQDGIAYAFRRHKPTPWTLPELIRRGMLTPMAAGLLSFLVDGQATMLVTGSRGAGKTSLLSALLLEVPQRFRVITIEDTPELPIHQLQEHGWKIQGLSTRAAISGASTELGASDALRTALRLGESVLVVGEVRGPEAQALYEAMRVGSAGNSVLGTIHGASTRDVYERVVNDLGVPPSSFKATDAVVVCAPLRHGGGMTRERRVTQISEVMKEGEGFADLMLHQDDLRATDSLRTGNSEALAAVAARWGLTIEDALENIRVRAEIKRELARRGTPYTEAGWVARANNMYWRLVEDHAEDILGRWQEWLS